MILDTNALSALLNGEPGFDRTLRRSRPVLPVIVLGEYFFGVKGSREQNELEATLRDFVRATHVLRIDEVTAAEYGRLRDQLKRNGRPIPMNDVWIAALARQHSLPVLSRDKHFDVVPGVTRIPF